MSALFPILAVIGFTPSYHAVHAGKATLHWAAHVHGAIMMGWLVLFFAQSLLAAKGNLKFHRKLGLAAAGFGVLVTLSLGAAMVRAILAFPPPVGAFEWDIVTFSAMAIPLFALQFGLAIALRRNVAVHKRLLFFATLLLIQAAVDRIHSLPWLDAAFFVRFLYLDALIIPLLVYDWLTVRRIHRATLWCGGALVSLQVAMIVGFGAPAVHQFWRNGSRLSSSPWWR